jgi:hypothetical protein
MAIVDITHNQYIGNRLWSTVISNKDFFHQKKSIAWVDFYEKVAITYYQRL